jgi:Cof subfamily protein (haloacid dehalogenase superfamily)
MTRIVFFDIDGTLRHEGRFPDSAKAAIQLLKEHGIIPVIATGRCEHEVAAWRAELGIDWALTCNGAHIGYQGKTMPGSTPFAPEVIDRWLQTADGRHTFLLYGADKMFSTNLECPYFAQASREIGFETPYPAKAGDKLPPIYQVIVFCEEPDEPLYTSGHPEPLYVHRWRPYAIDINPHGVNKATGILKLLDLLGIPAAEAAAFGDGKNDIEMIQTVGLGIAMGNACPELLECARYVTRHIEQDGILHGVQSLILGHQKKTTSGSLQ